MYVQLCLFVPATLPASPYLHVRSSVATMAVSMRQVSVSGARTAASKPARVVVCQAQGNKAQLAAATFAAAALLVTPAQAGVVLQQPELKKVFQDSGAPAPVKERPFKQPGAAPAVGATASAPAAKVKVSSEPLGEGGLDPRAAALPGALAGIAALAVAASKVDDGFNEWINESGALVRNSGNYAGFEEDIKGDNYLAPPGTRKTKAGTKKIGKK